MNTYDDIKYVNFISSQTKNYLDQVTDIISNKRKNDLIKTYDAKYTLPLVPLLSWFDKPHICRTDYYIDILNKYHHNGYCNRYHSIKFFVETEYGPCIHHDIKLNGLSAHNKYGTYMYYDDPKKIYLAHLNGRAFLTEDQKRDVRNKQITNH